MWVLLEHDQSIKQDRQVYFKGWSDFAPAVTEDLREAHTFRDKQEAKLSAAYRHKEFSFVPIEVEIVAIKNKAAA